MSHYDYLEITLERGAPAHRALAERLASAAVALAAAGGEVVGQFAPQLGWATNEAVVLIRWSRQDGDREAGFEAIDCGAPVEAVRRHGLTPALRGARDARLSPGGIYVHRWFTVEATSIAEFTGLSGQAWPDFEARFDARIFGLFEVERSADDIAEDEASMLLITRYADHGVWEASRDPTTEAMQLFAKRQALTRESRAASSLLVGA